MEINDIHRQIKALKACQKINGKEKISDLMQLFTTPQGVEFYQKTGFPTIEMWKEYRAEAQKYGIYVDAGDIELHGSQTVALIGNTHARLLFDDMASVGHTVIVAGGAMADITARNYAVVFTKNIGGVVEKHTEDNAIIQ